MAANESPAPSKRHRTRGRLIAAAVVVVALVAGFFYWLNARHYVTDDDAQVDGDIVNLSPRISGTIIAVHVQENQRVKAGDPIAELDPRDYEVAYQEAQAALAQAKASQAEAEQNRSRAKALTSAGAMAKSERDRLVSTADVDAAQVELAKSQLHQAQLTWATRRSSPPWRASSARSRSPRATACARPADPRHRATDGLWVTANFRETQLRRMHPGQPARIHVDALGSTSTARSRASAARPARGSASPPENASGNFVKVVQRIPVRIALDPGQAGLDRLRPGMSVEPEVRVR